LRIQQSPSKIYSKFIEKKVQLAKSIYDLLINVCSENWQIQEYVFSLIPNFLLQVKYIPEAVDVLIQIIGNNHSILLKIADEFDTDLKYDD